jgi:hypothetical protein
VLVRWQRGLGRSELLALDRETLVTRWASEDCPPRSAFRATSDALLSGHWKTRPGPTTVLAYDPASGSELSRVDVPGPSGSQLLAAGMLAFLPILTAGQTEAQVFVISDQGGS